MRERTVWTICLAGFLLLVLGFILSGCMLSGCAKNDLNGEKGSMQSSLPVDSGSHAPYKEQESTEMVLKSPQKLVFQGAINGTVLETMNASKYTYLLVDTGDDQVWAAVPGCTVEVGDMVEVPQGIPMDRFYSETLDRTFDLIYFSQGIQVKRAGEESGALPQGHPAIPGELPQGHPNISGTPSTSTGSEIPDIDFTGLEKAEGGTTIVGIFTNKDNLSGKEVVVRGKVVKFNRKILGKNWIHLRDGTGEEGTNDLTITSQAEVNVGDTVLVRGMVVLNQDFGFGYKYDVLIEDAEITKE